MIMNIILEKYAQTELPPKIKIPLRIPSFDKNLNTPFNYSNILKNKTDIINKMSSFDNDYLIGTLIQISLYHHEDVFDMKLHQNPLYHRSYIDT